MHPLTANLNGHINPVIDQQRHAIALGNCMESLGCLHGGCSIALLVAVLYACYAALKCSFDDLDEVLVAENGGRGVGDEVDAVVYYRLGHFVSCIGIFYGLFNVSL